MVVYLLSNHFSLLYGGEYTGIAFIIPVIALNSLLGLICGCIVNILSSSGSVWASALMNIGWSLLFTLFTYLLVGKYGAIGLAFSSLFAYQLHMVWQIIYLDRRVIHGIIKKNICQLLSFLLITIALSLMFMYNNRIMKMSYGIFDIIICLAISSWVIYIFINENMHKDNYSDLKIKIREMYRGRLSDD